MPRMIPAAPDPDAPASEKEVFRRLQETLPDDWVVLHGRRLVTTAEDGGRARPGAAPGSGAQPRETESDFIVFDPARGYLVLEVKGGGVGRDEGGWYSRSRSGERHRIKSPGEQASRAARLVDEKLRADPWFAKKGRRPAFGWGAVLPDVDVRGDLGPDLPRAAVIDRMDLVDGPLEAVERVFRAQVPDRGAPPPGTADPLVRVLAPSFELVPRLVADLDREREELVRLTAEQARILDMTASLTRAAIRGPAGSGKTMLALEKARRLAGQGLRVMLLCFNQPLSQALARQARGFEVRTFHDAAKALIDRARLPFRIPRERKEQQRFWEDTVPDLMLEAVNRLPEERWDAIVVDEGQDFRAHWWAAVDACLRDPATSPLFVFYDPNQDIYGGGPPEELGVQPLDLTLNCRNTVEIARYAAALVEAHTDVHPAAPPGEPPEEIVLHRPEDTADTVRRILDQVVTRGRVPPERVVVLSTHNPANSSLAASRRLGPFELVDLGAEPGPGRVRFASLQRFKGLEADVVILVDVCPGARTSSPAHLYVGASRARHRLFVVKIEEAPEQAEPA